MSSNDEAVSAFAIYRKKMLNKNQTNSVKGSTVLKKKNALRSQKKSRNSSDSFIKIINTNMKNGKMKKSKINKNKIDTSNREISLKNESSLVSIVKKQSKLNSDKTKKYIKNKERSSKKPRIEDEEPPLLIPISSTWKENDNIAINVESQTQHDNDVNESEEMNDVISTLHKTDPSPEGHKLFKWLIYPLGTKEFFKKYWEKNVLHIERKSPNYYTHLLTTQRLDDIFREFPLYYTRNVDVVSYENDVKEVHNEEGRVVASVLYDFYVNGCSIRVLNPQTYDQKIHLLISTLQEYFGTMVGTNVYLTPPGSQGFAPHYDDIEAFIVQLEGRKHWKLYGPKGNDILARYSSPNFKREELGDPFLEVTLEAGDLLYFPRGTIHEGRTDSETHSLHITVSVYQNTSYIDLLELIVPEALKKASHEDINFRKGLPVNYLRHFGYVNRNSNSEVRHSLIKNVKTLLNSMINYIDVDKAADNLGRKFMYDSMPPVLSKKEVNYTSKYDGDYMKDGKIFNRIEFEMDTEVRLVRYHCLRLVVEEEDAKIYYNTDNAKVYHGEEEQFLRIGNNLLPCIQKLQNTYPEFIKVDDLPIEDDLKINIVGDLWERGLLVTNGPLPLFSDQPEGESENDSDESISN